MIVIFAALFGILMGTMTAKRRGGKRADILQYAAGFGIAFATLGVVLTVIIEKIVT